MNPGLISFLVNRALRDSGFAAEDVDTIHVTEFDTHKLRAECRDENVFYNTWSPFGLFEEGVRMSI
jgi:homospermidine synthase